jgi:hypothetical protein
MKAIEALEKISAKYAPGVVAYYGQLADDPWQKAHDDLQASLISKDFDVIHAAADAFYQRCSELLDHFKRNSRASKEVSLKDAFELGSPELVKAIQSVKYKECYRCQTKEGLSLEAYGPEALQVRVACPQCKAKKGAA